MYEKTIITALFALVMAGLSGMAVQAREKQASQDFEPVLLGDADENASIDLNDASSILKMSLNLMSVPDDRLFYLDLDDDGQIGLEEYWQTITQWNLVPEDRKLIEDTVQGYSYVYEPYGLLRTLCSRNPKNIRNPHIFL